MLNPDAHRFVAVSYDGEEYWFAAADLEAARVLAADWFGRRNKTVEEVTYRDDYLAEKER